MFCITNNKCYVTRDATNKIKTTNILCDALLFQDKKKADNQLRAIPRHLKNLGFYVKDVGVVEPRKDYIPNVGKLDERWMTEDFCLRILHDVGGIYPWLNEQEKLLDEEMSVCDRKRYDLLHAIEFYTKGVVEGYHLYKELHDVSVRRRKVKNALLSISLIKDMMNGARTFQDVKERFMAVNKKYIVREPEMKRLFDQKDIGE